MKIEYNKKIGIGDIVKYNDNICIIAYDDDYDVVDFPYYLIDLSTMIVVGAFESIEIINKVNTITLISKNEDIKISF